jgi:hypothetical protein
MVPSMREYEKGLSGGDGRSLRRDPRAGIPPISFNDTETAREILLTYVRLQ